MEAEKVIEKINETKSWFFENINKINKLVSKLISKRRVRTQINKIRNDKGKVATNTTKIQGS